MPLQQAEIDRVKFVKTAMASTRKAFTCSGQLTLSDLNIKHASLFVPKHLENAEAVAAGCSWHDVVEPVSVMPFVDYTH